MWLWNYLVPEERQLSGRTFVEVFGAFLLLALYRAWDDDRRRPQLHFYRDERANPYYEEVRNDANGAQVRFLRVGLRNTGGVDFPRVWLMLEACSVKVPAVHLEERLRPMGHQPGDSEFTSPPEARPWSMY
jgi:hypothetical protein